MDYIEFSNEQSRQLIDAQQTFGALVPVVKELASLGSIKLRTSKGKAYAFDVHDGVRKSIGLATPELLREKSDRAERRKFLKARSLSMGKRLAAMAPVNRAHRLNRIRTVVARVLRELDRDGLLGSNVIVAGTNALHAYEIACGVIINQEHVGTTDADLVWDGNKALSLAASGVDRRTIMAALLRADKTFRADYGMNATNSDGFIVDLLCPEHADGKTIGSAGDLIATGMAGMEWLLASPRFEQVIVGGDGIPLRIVVPEPRTFALHKLWVSKQDSRPPLKQRRDRSHAALVAELVATYMRKLFTVKDMPWLPNDLRAMMKDVAAMASRKPK